MPIVTIQQSSRDLERKRRLVATLTQAFVDAYEVLPENVQAFIYEVDNGHLAKGGKLMIDAQS